MNARKQAKLTQKETSDVLGVTERQYRALENGTSDGSIKLWEKLRELFGISIDSLLERTEKKKI